MNAKRLLFFGAHPDDCDILCGGTAIAWRAAGHEVKFVSVTNGDTGHQTLSRRETAVRRKCEVAAAGRVADIEYTILDHSCGLEASLANRYELLKTIREFRPDVVISHRVCDYHPDHRAAAQLVLDTAYIVMVPHYCENTPVPEVTPIYAFSYDRFSEPRPFRADWVVPIDGVLDRKLAMLDCHTSQFYEWLPWIENIRSIDFSSYTPEAKKAWLGRWLDRCNIPEDAVKARLLKVAGIGCRYAEMFEQSPYSRRLAPEEFAQFMLP